MAALSKKKLQKGMEMSEFSEEASRASRLPQSEHFTNSISTFLQYLNDYRKHMLGPDLFVPIIDPNKFKAPEVGEIPLEFNNIEHWLPYKTLKDFPLSEEDLLNILKERGVCPLQCISRCFTGSDGNGNDSPNFYSPLPGLVYKPTIPMLGPHTLFPPFVGMHLLSDEVHHSYGELYNLNQIDTHKMVVGVSRKLKAVSGKSTTNYQPPEIIAITTGKMLDELREKISNASQVGGPAYDKTQGFAQERTKLFNNAMARLMFLASERGEISATMKHVFRENEEFEKSGKSLVRKVPVFRGVDPVANSIYERLWRIQHLDLFRFHVTMAHLIVNAQSLFATSFEYGALEMMINHIIMMAAPSVGKSTILEKSG